MAVGSIDFELQRMKLDVSDLVQQQAVDVIFKHLLKLGHEAFLQGKNLHVGPLYHCEDRPNIDGHFSKFKFDYMFLRPDANYGVAGWATFNTSEIDPSQPLVGPKENEGQP